MRISSTRSKIHSPYNDEFSDNRSMTNSRYNDEKYNYQTFGF